MIEHFVDDRGVVLRRDVIRAGFDDRLIISALRTGLIVRIHHGVCCLRAVWEPAHRGERHRIRSHAVRRLYPDDVARSHISAVLELGGPDWGHDLRTVHLTNLYGIGERTQSGIAHHRGVVRVGDVIRHDGSWLMAPARAALETAASAPRDPAVCVLTWVEASGLASRAELEAGAVLMKDWPGTISIVWKLLLSNGKSESIGEIRCDLLCIDHDIPRFVPQFEVIHPSGLLAGRTDGAWPQFRTLLEFDGLAKYLKHRREGETIEQCVVREKQREDLLRRITGWSMIRLTWADLERPEATAAMIRAHLDAVAA